MTETEKDETGLDDEIEVILLMTCKGKDCTRLFAPGGFSRPFTARKIIASIRKVGWTWVEGEKPTSGNPYCAECAP